VIAAFLPSFEAPGFKFGHWTARPGEFPFYTTSDTAAQFVNAVYACGWVVENLDWPEWMLTREAEQLRDSPDALAKATPEQLAQLLTVCIRQDRFVEGGLAGHFESGLLTRILKRARTLLEGIKA
jgi:hypothetical protein